SGGFERTKVRLLEAAEGSALTVHENFIVPEGMEDTVLECRYTVGLNERIYGEDYLSLFLLAK
ncbi:hypothetical protein OAD24_14620, partial [Pseudomonadales bacterium]|nr:hypothetical protein [Pseudomonadales bacterium]